MTGRPARNDTFSSLKQKRELAKIFEQVSALYKMQLKAVAPRGDGQIDLQRVALEFILKCLEDRQQELAVHSVTNDNDVDALKGLIASGQLKRMLITPKKQI